MLVRVRAITEKNGGACGAAKFREETSKKADSAAKSRIAAVHNVMNSPASPQGVFCNTCVHSLDIEGARW
jgi:hypothetical protein